MAKALLRFVWDFEKAPTFPTLTLPPFVFRDADPDERDLIAHVVSSALMMERAWTTGPADTRVLCERQAAAAFQSSPPACVVVQHGTRVIGASLLSFEPETESNLVSGPCILHEYRSRGLGSALLQHSLERLRAEGLRRASAVSLANSSVARYLYPKFGSAVEPVSTPPEKIAA